MYSVQVSKLKDLIRQQKLWFSYPTPCVVLSDGVVFYGAAAPLVATEAVDEEKGENYKAAEDYHVGA